MKVYATNEENLKKAERKNNFFYTLKKGKTVLRVMPPFGEEGVWFKEIREYCFNLGGKFTYLISPITEGQDDPIYQFIRSIYDEGDEEKIEKYKEWRPTKRFLMNVVVFSDPEGTTPDSGIKILKAPAKVKQVLRSFDTNVADGYGDITHLNDGFKFTIDREGEKLNTVYTVNPHRERTDFEKEMLEKNINISEWQLFDLNEYANPTSADKLQDVLDQLLHKNQDYTEMFEENKDTEEVKQETEVKVNTESEVPDIPAPPEVEE